MPSPGSFLRQLSGKEGWKSRSRRWDGAGNNRGCGGGVGWKESLKQMEGLNNMYRNENGMLYGMKKRVMVVVDQSSHSKHAMMWALTHVTNKGDILTLLHIVPSSCKGSDASAGSGSPYLATTLGSLCKACKPEVEVEALMIQGPKLGTVMSQVKKLEVSVLVLGQKKPSPLLNCLCLKSSTEEFVDQCINVLDCLTIGVRKQSQGVSGYLISTRWHKNFWLLA
ncbi:Adenine nucleotide alpha hydrolase-like superfamily protein [Abeliophyllum distichum]|uniref:Adenine nucleotide alpha hydrolase-like superfamily protein n=1 Tax=Abeliophyllum distichum TaxID=126358 RepID=A0ABD1NWY7_9LAMI